MRRRRKTVHGIPVHGRSTVNRPGGTIVDARRSTEGFVGGKEAERDLPDLGPADLGAVAERAVMGGQEPVVLAVKRHRAHAAKRLVVETGHPGVDLEILEQAEDLDRGARQDREGYVRMAGPVRRRQRRHHGEGGRHGGDLDVTGGALLEGPNLLLHRPGIADDTARPVKHALALRREAEEARAAMDEQNAERVFELLDSRRKRRLRHAARFGGAAEMLLAGESDQIFQLVDHARTTFQITNLRVLSAFLTDSSSSRARNRCTGARPSRAFGTAKS
jgi:hypothetical protein